MMLLELAKRVKKGVKLLDRRIPNWRRTIKEHADEFDFTSGECCVLGTLEHYNGRMRVLAKRRGANDGYPYSTAEAALGINGREFGFDVDMRFRNTYGDAAENTKQYDVLTALWMAEIGL